MARPSTAAIRLLPGEREPVYVATTGNITLAGIQTIDGAPGGAGRRVLARLQTNKKENGIYTMNAGIWQRAPDARNSRAINKGVTVHVQAGDTLAGNVYVFRTLDPNIGDDEIEVELYLSEAIVDQVNTALSDALSQIGDALASALGTIGATVVADYGSRAIVEATVVPAETTFFRTAGYYAPGDGGHGLYSEVDEDPESALAIEDAGGRFFASAEVDHFSARLCGVKANGIDDDTEALRKFAIAVRGKRGTLPVGLMKTTSDPSNPVLEIDAAYPLIIEGEGGNRGNGEPGGSIIFNTGTGHCILGDNSDHAAADRKIILRQFVVRGQANSRHNVWFRDFYGLRLEHLDVQSAGWDNVRWDRCFNSEIFDLFSSNAKRRGLILDSAANCVDVIGGVIASNDRSGVGYANMELNALVTTEENNGVNIIGVDLSPYTIALYGLIVKKTHGLVIQGCDFELPREGGDCLYADDTVRGMTLAGNMFSGRCYLEEAKDCMVLPNTFYGGDGELSVLTTDESDNVGVAAQFLWSGSSETLTGPGVYKIGREP